ncbi:MAG: pyridoxamine 5'-phosphate oxidase [Aquificae bacterium]|nr:pyridoxamine 5'-phosphate oxidase [Aquificota bacterium]
MDRLDKNLLDLLKDLTPSVVATVTPDNKPYTTFVSWLIALDESTIRFAISSDSRTADNIRNNPYTSIEVFGPEIAASILGKAKIIKEKIEELPFPVSVIEVKVEEVNNNLFPGATITGEIPFEHTGNIQKALEFDTIVLNALRD